MRRWRGLRGSNGVDQYMVAFSLSMAPLAEMGHGWVAYMACIGRLSTFSTSYYPLHPLPPTPPTPHTPYHALHSAQGVRYELPVQPPAALARWTQPALPQTSVAARAWQRGRASLGTESS